MVLESMPNTVRCLLYINSFMNRQLISGIRIWISLLHSFSVISRAPLVNARCEMMGSPEKFLLGAVDLPFPHDCDL